MTTPNSTMPSSRPWVNATTTAVLAYSLAPNAMGLFPRNAAAATAAVAVLNLPEEGQTYARLGNSVFGGTALAWKLSSSDTSAKSFMISAGLASSAIFLFQNFFEQIFDTRAQAPQAVPTTQTVVVLPVPQNVHMAQNPIPFRPQTQGPQSVAQTAYTQQRVPVGVPTAQTVQGHANPTQGLPQTPRHPTVAQTASMQQRVPVGVPTTQTVQVPVNPLQGRPQTQGPQSVAQTASMQQRDQVGSRA